jgi:hypothetical protein
LKPLPSLPLDLGPAPVDPARSTGCRACGSPRPATRVSVQDAHYDTPRSARTRARARTVVEKRFLALGPDDAEAFLVGAAAAAVRLPAELADLLALHDAHGPEVFLPALRRAVAFRRWRATDVRSILAAGLGAPSWWCSSGGLLRGRAVEAGGDVVGQGPDRGDGQVARGGGVEGVPRRGVGWGPSGGPPPSRPSPTCVLPRNCVRAKKNPFWVGPSKKLCCQVLPAKHARETCQPNAGQRRWHSNLTVDTGTTTFGVWHPRSRPLGRGLRLRVSQIPGAAWRRAIVMPPLDRPLSPVS